MKTSRKSALLLFSAWICLLVCGCGGQAATGEKADAEQDIWTEPREVPAWLDEVSVWEKALAIYLAPGDEAFLKKWLVCPNFIINAAAADRLREQQPALSPATVKQNRLELAQDAWSAKAVFAGVEVGGPEFTARLISQLRGAAVSDDPDLAAARHDRLGTGQPLIELRGKTGSLLRLWPDGALLGPHAPRSERDFYRLADEAGLEAVRSFWMEELAGPGAGGAAHLGRLRALIACGDNDLIEPALRELEKLTDSEAVRDGDFDLLAYFYHREKARPEQAAAHLACLVTAHPGHPFVKETGLAALANVYFQNRDWKAYRDLWEEFGPKVLGEIPPEVAERLRLINVVRYAEILWERGETDLQGRYTIQDVVDALEKLPDYNREYVWLERYLAENPKDFMEILRMADTLIKLKRYDQAEELLIGLAENDASTATARVKFYEKLVALYKIRSEPEKRAWAREKYEAMRKQAAKMLDAQPPGK